MVSKALFNSSDFASVSNVLPVGRAIDQDSLSGAQTFLPVSRSLLLLIKQELHRF